jgi:exonuclease SbcC
LKARNLAEKDRLTFNDLAGAFGRNGIQAMIIETAIPQIQDEANEMLFRLTDGSLSLRFDLTEGRIDHNTGNPSEQLEIRVSDEMGTRSYETFSGGESFRINFAIRIALSKLLANRSGAPLPILFIDEGFGSQDEIGQDRLKEAINFIRNDFEKILVITHIEEIKDSFPTRIEVEKTPSGSTYTLVS